MKKKILVTIKEDHLNDMEAISQTLENAGLTVNKIFVSGIIAGEIEETKVTNINNLPVVAAIDFDEQVNISPPDADIQ